jgi:hypothetical protein
VDLRCYALTTPRHDGKVSVHFIDVDDFRHEWSLENLPWDAATPVEPGSVHGEQLDQKLVDALLDKPIPETIDKKTRTAALAFLYLYMVLTHGGERYSLLVRIYYAPADHPLGHRSTSVPARRCRSEQV